VTVLYGPQVVALAAELRRIEQERDTAIARADTAERQLAEARAVTEGLQEEIGDWKDATMLLVGGDPDGVTPKHLNRELLDLRRAVRLAFDEVTEADGWRTEWWAEEWVPMAEDLLSDNPARRALATEEPTDDE
jgi:hypothetical protein